MKTDFRKYLSGGDLRSIAGSNDVVRLVKSQQDFDDLFAFIYDENRLIVMRTADAAEKISLKHPEYLAPHVAAIITLCAVTAHKELKWHLALLLPRVSLATAQKDEAVKILQNWVQDNDESVIVRVNALQALFEMGYFKSVTLENDVDLPAALRARIKKLETRLS